MFMNVFELIANEAQHNTLLQLSAMAIIMDSVFGVMRACKEKKFNSCFGINGAIRKTGMLVSLVALLLVDQLISINLIGFVPLEAREWIHIEKVGLCEFFAILYISYEVVSILKNMYLCDLPVKKLWLKVKSWLSKYTDELPDDEEVK